LSKDFLKLVAVAIVVGLPAAYFAVQRWLTDFAFRIDLGPTPFVLAAAAAFAVAGLTVSYHAVRAARLNPSRTLRSE
jgi:putative ABC transport system permease protein